MYKNTPISVKTILFNQICFVNKRYICYIKLAVVQPEPSYFLFLNATFAKNKKNDVATFTIFAYIILTMIVSLWEAKGNF